MVDTILIVSGIAAIIIGVVVYYFRIRLRLRPRPEEPITISTRDIEEKMLQIRELGTARKYREGLIEAWRAFSMHAARSYRAPRKVSQSPREYFAMFTQKAGIAPRSPLGRALLDLLHGFEHARYGRSEVTSEEFEKAYKSLVEIMKVSGEKAFANSTSTSDH